MGMRVTCAWCKTRVEKKNSVFKANGKYNTYYCCQEHMDEALKKKKETQKEKEALQVKKEKIKKEKEEIKRAKEEAKKEREEVKKIKEKQKTEKKQRKIDPVYEEIADIFGYRIQNSALFAEMKLWRGICDDAKILAYLQENKDYIKKKVDSLSSTEFLKIRYVSAILKNNLADYKKMEKPEIVEKKMDNTFYDISNVLNKSKRRALDDLEDEV